MVEFPLEARRVVFFVVFLIWSAIQRSPYPLGLGVSGCANGLLSTGEPNDGASVRDQADCNTLRCDLKGENGLLRALRDLTNRSRARGTETAPANNQVYGARRPGAVAILNPARESLQCDPAKAKYNV